mmetsp:Transcript_8233/g.12410  ORF Transcript_8233/g.12410 Transcript_8233/m.12410 type:complete len:377 (+) Transcript_8233:65-1195(+)
MSSHADALSQLRDCFMENNIEKKEVVYDPASKKLVIRDNSFPIGTSTIYRSGKTGKPYKLGDIWFFLTKYELARTKMGQYTRECVKNKVAPVKIDDQAGLYKYMTGAADTSENLDFDLGAAASKDAEEAVTLKDSAKWTIEDIFNREKLLASRSTMLQSTKIKDYAAVSKRFEDVIEARKRKKEDPKQHSSRHSTPSRAVKRAKRDPNAEVPIIIVPQAITSLINMYNCEDLLDKGAFVNPNTKRQESGSSKPTQVVFQRKSFSDATKDCKYMVIDNIKELKKEDWVRVVAVFVSGAEWQFKGWPWTDVAQIFDNVCAFHLHYDDELLNPKIRSWRCHRLTVSKIKRYRDRSMVMDFWQKVTAFVAPRNQVRGLVF